MDLDLCVILEEDREKLAPIEYSKATNNKLRKKKKETIPRVSRYSSSSSKSDVPIEKPPDKALKRRVLGLWERSRMPP